EAKESGNPLSFSSSDSSSAGPSPVQMRRSNNPPWQSTNSNEHQQSRTPNFRGGFPVGRGRGRGSGGARDGGTSGRRSDVCGRIRVWNNNIADGMKEARYGRRFTTAN